MTVRTRFAPSPTGTLHLGNVRTAVFAWAFARHHGGQFILRIEDTDQARSSDASAAGIVRDLHWLGLDFDEGPFFQMQRLERYQSAIARLLAEGKAYYCYMGEAELTALREGQRARQEKPRYDGRWRPENGLVPPTDVRPAIRFRNPDAGAVQWDDAVKGPIAIQNTELDDLVIARADGTPTYNFCVVVDDIDMRISHVVRGDGHVDNTPRQINIFRALGVEPPVFAHLPTVLGADGEKLSKRHGATGVNEYAEAGYLPEALINGLARMGFAHGNDEVFSPAQLVEWFALDRLTASSARFDATKFEWLAAEHFKRADPAQIAEAARPFCARAGLDLESGPRWPDVVGLLKDRSNTFGALVAAARVFYEAPTVDAAAFGEHLSDTNRAALAATADHLEALAVWDKPTLGAALKGLQSQFNLKPPQFLMPLRIALTGSAQAPAVDALLLVLGKVAALARLRAAF